MGETVLNPVTATGSKVARQIAGLLVMLCLSGMAGAQPDEPELPPTASPELAARSALEISEELQSRLGDIERVESELGLFDPSLVEMYADLARFFSEQGDHEAAADSYRQAFQLTRMATGLNSEAQLPLIDKVIDSSSAMRDWEAVDDMHELRYYLKNRLYEPGDPRYADAVAELGRWKLRNMRENLLEDGYRQLGRDAEQLSDIYQESIAKIQASPDYSEASLVALYQGKSQADLEVARFLAETPYHYFEGTVSRWVYQTVCSNVSDGQGNVVRQCTQVRRENPRYRESQRDNKRMMVNRSVREVEVSLRNLNDIMARNSDIPPAQREQLTSQIRQLQVEYERIQRNSRREWLF